MIVFNEGNIIFIFITKITKITSKNLFFVNVVKVEVVHVKEDKNKGLWEGILWCEEVDVLFL